MSEPTTAQPAASAEPTLEQLEQAVIAAGQTDSTTESEQQPDEETPSDEGQVYKSLAEKKGFKNVDDLAESYQYMESRSTRSEQKVRQLENTLSQMQAEMEKLKQIQGGELTPEQDQALALLERTIDHAVSKRLEPIIQDQGVKKVEAQLNVIKSAYPWASNQDLDNTLDLMLQHPTINMEDAFKMATFDRAATVRQQTERRQAQDTQKKRAFVESASGARTGDSIDYSKLTLQEMEDIIPKADTKFIDSRGQLRRG